MSKVHIIEQLKLFLKNSVHERTQVFSKDWNLFENNHSRIIFKIKLNTCMYIFPIFIQILIGVELFI